MVLNIGAILGGAAEQIVDMQEDKIQRVNLLTDNIGINTHKICLIKKQRKMQKQN